MATVTINRNPKDDVFSCEAVEVSTAKLRGRLFTDNDPTDPLNPHMVVGLMVNERLLLRVRAEWRESARAQDGEAIAALAAAIIENYAEIRDVLAEKD